MKRLLLFGAAVAVLAGATGCAGSLSRVPPPNPHTAIPAAKPPSPATWPAYPHFSQPSCWARPFLGGEIARVERVAPSYAPARRAHPIPPATVADNILARLGDKRYVHKITFAPAPPAVGRRVHVLYAGGHPPADALTATIVSSGSQPLQHPTPAQSLASGIASWESGLVAGALRDDMCAAGGAPLVSWTSADGGEFSESGSALEQRFPNPSPAAFRRRVALVGRRYGFRIASLRLLQPEQAAPLLVVDTSRSRKAFVRDIEAIVTALNPTNTVGRESADTFEGFFLAAEDAHGPFAFVESLSRGQAEGGEWSWNRCDYPYPTLGPVVGGCGSPPRPVAPSPTALRFSTAANRRFASRDVRKLIRIVVVPSIARPVSQIPQSAPVWLRDQAKGFRRMGTATTHRIWIVREPLKTVVRFVRANARPRPRPEARYRTGGSRIGSRPSSSYEFPPIPGRSWSRWLNIDMSALPNGSTVVFAQAGDEWNHTPPRSTEIRGHVKRIDIVSRLGMQRPNVLVHVRKAYDVGWIVALTNGLGVVPHNVGCLLDARFGGRAVTLRFRAADGHVLARATVPDFGGAGTSGPCNPLELTIGSRPAVPLIGADLLLRIQRLLNVDLAPPLPRYVSDCLLRQHGWKIAGARTLTASKGGKRWTITFHLTGKVTADKPAPPQLRRCLRAGPRSVIYG